jgi:hypothetical protein
MFTNTCKVAVKLRIDLSVAFGVGGGEGRKVAPDETRPQLGGACETRTADGGAIILTGHETRALPRSRGTLAKPVANSLGTARTGGEPSITISVSRATPMSATKRHALRRTAWCCIRRATTTRSIFIACMGFFRIISDGSRDAE